MYGYVLILHKKGHVLKRRLERKHEKLVPDLKYDALSYTACGDQTASAMQCLLLRGFNMFNLISVNAP